MATEAPYQAYLSDRDRMNRYTAYQRRYRTAVRESDRVLIDQIKAAVEQRAGSDGPAHVLDIGCSTGNLLYHVRAACPEARLTGADLAESAVEACRRDPELAGIDFHVQSILDLDADPVHRGRYDVIVENAVTFLLDDGEYNRAVEAIAACLKPGGTFLSFTWMHPYEQSLTIEERSLTYPQGVTIHARPYSVVRKVIGDHGFHPPHFMPFDIPIDLDGTPFGSNEDGYEDLNSRTVRLVDGTRLLFRGAIYQPWCHLVATL